MFTHLKGYYQLKSFETKIHKAIEISDKKYLKILKEDDIKLIIDTVLLNDY
jgi:hypothetical protein